ncbi:hypothetical protein OF83DRAFT_1089489, partial [Amylostereum chailletii]
HEVSLVTRGHRVTLTYNLYFGDMEKGGNAGATNARMAILAANEAQIRGCLETALADPTFLPDGGTLGFGLCHVYPFSDSISHVPRLLKGRDATIHRVLASLGLEPTVYLGYSAEDQIDFLLTEPFETGGRCIDDNYTYLEAVRDNGGIVLEYWRNDREVDESVAWVTGVAEGLNSCSRAFARYGNAPSFGYSYGEMCLVVRVGESKDRTTPPDWETLKAAAWRTRRHVARRIWNDERLRVGDLSYTESSLASDGEPLTDSESEDGYDEPDVPEDYIDLPPDPSPVYALPVELLCRIFAELGREEPLGYDSDDDDSDDDNSDDDDSDDDDSDDDDSDDDDSDDDAGERNPSWYISDDEDSENDDDDDDDDEASDTSDRSSTSSECASSLSGDSLRRGSLGWAKVTHVCRHWRDSDALFPLSTPQAFVHAASVEHLRLAGKCGADKLASFIRALELDAGGAVYFPSLSSLALPNIGLRSAPSEGESDPSVEGALRSMLALRGAAGHRIGTLHVDKGTFKRQRTSREPWMDDLDVKVVPRGYASGEHRLWR